MHVALVVNRRRPRPKRVDPRGVETPDGKIDAVIAADTIRDSLHAKGITKEVPVS
jgi:hypothetical protein